MVKKILSHVGEFKKDSLLTPLCVSGETVLEVLIPLMMAAIIDNGLNTGNMKYVFGVGLVMLAMAMASLACGVLAGRYASRASTGLPLMKAEEEMTSCIPLSISDLSVSYCLFKSLNCMIFPAFSMTK